uniref:Uncharacterized protein n=1 Tax=Tanacetum cinerariifolium TaxID=118510 RepID=A0A699GWP5_TANCI|nr:hypothetical protein [Tanacetum cinerariifolium]
MTFDLFFFSSSGDEDEVDSELAMFTEVGILALMKCTFAICQMAYGAVLDSLDEYLQMGATTARDSLRIFCKVIMNLYGEEFLRKPTYTDMEKLYAHHDEKHGFPGMGDHGPDPFILLEAIASQDLRIWHAFFGVSRMNNDLRQTSLFNDLKSGRAPNVPSWLTTSPFSDKKLSVDRRREKADVAKQP